MKKLTKKFVIWTMRIIFVLGIILGLTIATIYFYSKEYPRKYEMRDIINNDDISVLNFEDKSTIIIYRLNRKLAISDVMGTGSMLPGIPSNSTLIFELITEEDSVFIGDIIVFDVVGLGFPIAHRIVDIREDEEGIYYVTKADAHFVRDKQKTRKEDILYRVIGIIF